MCDYIYLHEFHVKWCPSQDEMGPLPCGSNCRHVIMVYGQILIAGMFAALVATPVFAWLAVSTKVVDRPGTRKVHGHTVPRMGGLAIVLAMLVALLLATVTDTAVGPQLRQAGLSRATMVLFGASALVLLVGLVDDIRRLRARTKLLGQIVAALCVCSAGFRIETLGVEGLFLIHFGVMSWPLTVLWLVGITNAVNLIDGLDGLAGGVSLIAAAVIATFAFVQGQVVIAACMMAMVGALSGFLFFNFNPAKVFLGDCGSMFLGFFLATAGLMSVKQSHTLVGMGLVVLALGVPILDTFFSILRRMLDRRSLFAPDRGHTHHRLMDTGRSHRTAVLVLYGVSLTSGMLGLLMLMISGLARVAVFTGGLAGLVYLFHRLGAIRLREALATLKRNLAMSGEAKVRRRRFEEMQLRLREARTIPQWWRVVRRASRHLGFARICVQVQYDNGESRELQWYLPGHRGNGTNGKAVHLTLPVRHWPDGQTVRASIDIPVNGSLESAGSRLTLFGRLMDEHSLADLRGSSGQADASARGADLLPTGGTYVSDVSHAPVVPSQADTQ